MAADYQPVDKRPAYLRRGVATTSEYPVAIDSVLTAPDSGTYSLRDSGGTLVVDAQAVTVTASIATYAVTPSSTQALGDRYVESWSLVFSGATKVFERRAVVCRTVPYLSIPTSKLTGAHPELTRQYPNSTDLESFIELAEEELTLWLERQGRRAELVIDDGALDLAMLYLALRNTFRSLNPGPGTRYDELEQKYDRLAERELESVVLDFDADEDGNITEAEADQTAQQIVYTGFTGNPRFEGY